MTVRLFKSKRCAPSFSVYFVHNWIKSVKEALSHLSLVKDTLLEGEVRQGRGVKEMEGRENE